MNVATSVALGAVLIVSTEAKGAQSCLEPEQIKETDKKYEAALLQGGCSFLRELLADEFVWVHNDAGATDTKQNATCDYVRRSVGIDDGVSRVLRC